MKRNIELLLTNINHIYKLDENVYEEGDLITSDKKPINIFEQKTKEIVSYIQELRNDLSEINTKSNWREPDLQDLKELIELLEDIKKNTLLINII